LSTFEKRQQFSWCMRENRLWARKMGTDLRKKLVKKVLKKGYSVSEACRQLGVSRPTFYKWLRRFEKYGESKRAFSYRYRRLPFYKNQASKRVERLIKNIVVADPRLSKYDIQKRLPRFFGKPVLEVHGVYNVLRRNDLNTYEKRALFAQS